MLENHSWGWRNEIQNQDTARHERIFQLLKDKNGCLWQEKLGLEMKQFLALFWG
jgi:hypothetical protein